MKPVSQKCPARRPARRRTSVPARFSSGLSVMDFLKRTTLARMTPSALLAMGPAAETLAASEGLEAHGLSVRARLERLNKDDPP